ncbi:uncharacterized protein LOC106664782 [Cimex lectularius]|uniref:Integrase catalytic domain-containing protein n=1 Tax=Cimex lectularius TaxID=79782 RepID=A0A8I6TLX8_CIMLE|nr:uncharacterized protein LOC106664782 [Cimex lectularius]
MSMLQDMTYGIDKLMVRNDPCEVCIKGKHVRLPFKRSKFRAQKPLELVHTDLCGPMETKSIGGNRYFFILIDDYSRYTMIYFLKSKDEVTQVFKEYCALVENEMNLQIKTLRSDNGMEYINRNMENFLREKGIKHQRTVRYTPQQNGLAERANRAIVDKARCLLQDAGLPKEYWAEAVSTAVYLNNRSPTKSLSNKTPYEAWYSRKPNLRFLKIFGCEAMVQVPKERRRKWDPRSEKMIFVGYCQNTKGYRLIDPVTKKVTISRDVIFLEEKMINNSELQNIKDIYHSPDIHNEEEIVSDDEQEITQDNQSEECHEIEHYNQGQQEELEINQEQVRRTKRTPKPKFDPDFVYLLSENDDPSTVMEARQSPQAAKWEAAMSEELNSFAENDTFEWANLPKGETALRTKWVFKLKKSTKEEAKYKARLVVKGCSQRQGIDYEETFSPVVKYPSLRFLFALATKKDMNITHMDVKTAYLQGQIDKEIYVIPPEEMKNKPKGKVWLLKRAMYGLKQSGRCWNQRLHTVMTGLGLQQSKADPCIYFKVIPDGMIVIAIYVDDLLIFSNQCDLQTCVTQKLENEFSMKNLGEVKDCLGMNITRDRKLGKLWINQTTYIKKIIEKFGMSEANPVLTPMEPGIILRELVKSDVNSAQCNDSVPYQQAIGSLLYVSQISRPDIAFAVNSLSQFNNNPLKCHWQAVKRVIRYLKGTSDLKLEFSKNENSNLLCFSDADWGNKNNDRHSVSGSSFKYMGGLISWASKKQRTVALSTVEAEYVALSCTVQEAMWLRVLFKELANETMPTTVFCDNMGAIHLAQNNVTSQRSKHIDIRYHFIRESVQGKLIKLNYLPTEQMLSDILTKPLNREKHVHFVKMMGLV